MAVEESLAAVLSSPTPSAVFDLRSHLLELDVADDARIWPLLESFHGFLDRLETGTTSRDYSQLASKLDIGAISGVILEHLTEDAEPPERAMRLLSGALSEGLMALATRQHVRAWEGELAAVYRDAVWFLYEQMWRWTRRRTPDLEPPERRRLMDALFEPLRSCETPADHRAILIGRLFQLLIKEAVGELVNIGSRSS